MSITSRRKKERKDQFREEIQIQEKDFTTMKAVLCTRNRSTSEEFSNVVEIPRNMKVMIFTRVSGTDQKYNKNMERLKTAAINELSEIRSDLKVVKSCEFQEQANFGLDRPQFVKALQEGEKSNVDVLVFATPDRICRAEGFHPTENNEITPTRREWKETFKLIRKHCTKPVYVLSPVDCTNQESRLFLSNLARKHNEDRNSTKVGRPKKVGRKKKKLETKQELIKRWTDRILQSSLSSRKMAKFIEEIEHVKISHETIAKLRKTLGNS